MPDESGRYTSINGQRLTPNQYLIWPTHIPGMQPAQQQQGSQQPGGTGMIKDVATGKITYFGTPTQEQPENTIPSVDSLIQRQDKQAVQQLQQKFSQASSQIDRVANDAKQAISNQFRIRQADFRRKFNAEKDPDRKQAIEDQMLSAKSAATGKIQAIDDKHAPARRELQTAMNVEAQKLKGAAQQRRVQLQTIRQLEQANLMDATHAKKAAYKLAGINWEPPKQQIEQAKTAIETDLRGLRAIIKAYDYKPKAGMQTFGVTPYGKLTDPITGKIRKATKEDAEQIQLLKKREGQLVENLQNLYMQSDPRFRMPIERAQQWAEASKALAGGDRSNIETAILDKLGKQNKGKLVRMRAPDGRVGGIPQKNVAAALAQGYERVQ